MSSMIGPIVGCWCNPYEEHFDFWWWIRYLVNLYWADYFRRPLSAARPTNTDFLLDCSKLAHASLVDLIATHCSTNLSDSMRPSRSETIRSVRLASDGSCVTKTSVVP